MREAITYGRRHGAKAREVISGPDVPIAKQLDSFKEFQGAVEHKDFEYVELWTSDSGLTKRRKLNKPHTAPAAPKVAPKSQHVTKP
jgi:hypothetical protein